MPHRVTPKNLVLDLFRVAPEASPAPIASLVELGALFGFGASTMRATVSRLTSAGLLESDARGWYRPAPTTDPFRAAIESWREGEARLRPWAGDWLALEMESHGSRTEQRRAERGLRHMGFRPGLARLWLRPDNLAPSRPKLMAQLEALGTTRLEELVTVRDVSTRRVARWCDELWDVCGLEAAYRSCTREIETRVQRIDALPPERALVETFVYGGHAIRILALDPLLPAELVDTELRRTLHERMVEYDRVGRARWHDRFLGGGARSAEVLQ